MNWKDWFRWSLQLGVLEIRAMETDEGVYVSTNREITPRTRNAILLELMPVKK